MDITVRNCKKQKIKRKEIAYATNWYGEMLMGKRLCKNLKIDIIFQELGDYHGFCGIMDDEYKPRYFELLISWEEERPTILRSIAHEMVHVKQFARRELVDTSHDKSKYLGSVIKTDDVDYWDLPFEIEAFGREIGLYTRYTEHLNRDTKLLRRLMK